MNEENTLTGSETEFYGSSGISWRVPVTQDVRNASKDICTWLLYAPAAHPLWQFYSLYVIRLREMPEMPPPRLKFEGATHEVGVLSLDPEHQPYTVAKILQFAEGSGIPWLGPPQVNVQFECTDEEALQLGTYSARAVAHGHILPEDQLSGDAQRYWTTALVKTLAHIRGEEHAS
jgi:hypothetical protein